MRIVHWRGKTNWRVLPGFSRIRAACIRKKYSLVLIACSLLYLYLSLTRCLGAGRDDFFITLWAAEKVADGTGLVNHNLEPCEISSSLLHVLILAVLHKLAPDHIFTINKCLGMMCGLLGLVTVYYFKAILFARSASPFWEYMLATIALAANPVFLYWNLGSLETPYVTLFLLLYACCIVHKWQFPEKRTEWGLALIAAIFATVRPEGFYLALFAGVFVGCFFWVHGPQKRLLKAVHIPIIVIVALAAFRYVKFGLFFPLPVYAKSYSLSAALPLGGGYFYNFFTSDSFFFFAAGTLFFLFFLHGRNILQALRRRDPLCLSDDGMLFVYGLILVVFAFVLVSGGDWMENFRFFAPVVPLIIITCVRFVFQMSALASEVHATKPTVADMWAASTLVAALILLNLFHRSANPRTVPPDYEWDLCAKNASLEYRFCDVLNSDNFESALMRLNAAHARDIRGMLPFIAGPLKQMCSKEKKICLLTGQMGLIPYMIKHELPNAEIRILDSAGICDPFIAQWHYKNRHADVTFQMDLVGPLEGRADGLSEYLRSQAPNLIYDIANSPKQTRRLNSLGYELIWDKPGAFVFHMKEGFSLAPFAGVL